MAKVYFKSDWPRLVDELSSSYGPPVSTALKQTLKITAELAEYIATLDDPKLKWFMCRLHLYEVTDSSSPEYNPEVFKILEDEMEKIKKPVKPL